MPRKPPEWRFKKQYAALIDWKNGYDGRHAKNLERKLSNSQEELPPFSYARTLSEGNIETAAEGALLAIATHSQDGWSVLHRAWRSEALFATSHLQHKDHRLTEFRKNREPIPPNFRPIDFTELNHGALAWCGAIVFDEKRYLKMWGDRIVRAIAAGDPLLEENAFAAFGGAPFEYFIVQLHALWGRSEFQSSGKLPDQWPVYAKIFETWDGPLGKFREAVHGICQYHCDHCWDLSWGGHQAFYGVPFPIFPVEILALKKVRESLGLPFPDLDHKLVNDNPLFCPPDPIPKAKATDQWEIRTIARMRDVFPQLKLPFDELPLDSSLSVSGKPPQTKAAKKPATKTKVAKKVAKKNTKK